MWKRAGVGWKNYLSISFTILSMIFVGAVGLLVRIAKQSHLPEFVLQYPLRHLEPLIEPVFAKIRSL